MPVACGVADKFVSFIGVGALLKVLLGGVLGCRTALGLLGFVGPCGV